MQPLTRGPEADETKTMTVTLPTPRPSVTARSAAAPCNALELCGCNDIDEPHRLMDTDCLQRLGLKWADLTTGHYHEAGDNEEVTSPSSVAVLAS